MGKRLSLRKREQILHRLRGSGLSAAEYCRRRGLCYGTVMRWQREARALDEGTGSELLPAFVEVELDQSKAANQKPEKRPDSSAMLCVELSLPGGAMLRVYENGKSAHRP